MDYIIHSEDGNDYLCHHGVKGQKWGVRRYQNEDGSYKNGAQGRYDSDGGSHHSSFKNRVLSKIYTINENYYRKHGNATAANMNKYAREHLSDNKSSKRKGMTAAQKKKLKTAAGVAAGVAGAGLAAYGTYRLVKSGKGKQLITAAGNAGKNVYRKTSSVAKNTVNRVKSSNAYGKASDIVRRTGITAREIGSNAKIYGKSAVSSVRGAAGKAGSMAKSAYGKAGSMAKSAYGKAGSLAKGVASTAKSAYGKAGSLAKGAVSTAKSAYGKAGSMAKGAVSSVKGAASTVSKKAKQAKTIASKSFAMGKKVSGVTRNVTSATKKAVSAAKSGYTKVTSKASSIKAYLNSGHTYAEAAKKFNVPQGSISTIINDTMRRAYRR